MKIQIPKLTKSQKQVAIVTAAVAVATVAYFALRAPRMKSIYDWDDDINAAQGHPFTVRVPRGTYGVSSPDLVIVSELDVGTETHVTMMPPLQQPETYEIKAVMVDEGGQMFFPIIVTARPANVYNEIPTRNRAPLHAAGSTFAMGIDDMGAARIVHASALFGGQRS